MFKYFKNLVELRTKVASVFPFFYVLGIYLYLCDGYQFNVTNAIIFFISMLSLDMATTVLNHIVGIKKEENVSIFDQELITQMDRLNITDNDNKRIFYVLLTIGVFSGLLLVWLSNVLVLLIGMLCIGVAIAYSYGPVPVKNTYVGEVVSGVTMGVFIPLAFLCCQDQNLFINSFSINELVLDVRMMIKWGTILLVPTLLIANIMLANNICDMEKDKDNKRLTLPLIIGKQNSLVLWGIMYMFAILCIIIMILFSVVPKFCILGLVVIPFVIINIVQFVANPQKSLTFKYAVYNLQLLLLAVIIPTFVNLIYFR